MKPLNPTTTRVTELIERVNHISQTLTSLVASHEVDGDTLDQLVQAISPQDLPDEFDGLVKEAYVAALTALTRIANAEDTSASTEERLTASATLLSLVVAAAAPRC